MPLMSRRLCHQSSPDLDLDGLGWRTSIFRSQPHTSAWINESSQILNEGDIFLMHNHVTTRCIVTGPTEDIKAFHGAMIRVPEGGTEMTLDFDRIIPMPEVIKNTDNARDLDLGIEILLGSPRPDVPLSSCLTRPWV